MANGYLGKISAVVSASTGDFDSKLAKSAKEVANFASRVQGNLTSASTQAARALEGIYTPLQKVERSLRAAESMKLSFKGFKGLIGDVDALQRRLQGLNERQIDIVLRTSGMKSITEFRDAINGLTSKDVEIITRVGGLEKINELREQIRSSPAVMKVAADVESAKERIQTLKQEIKSAADSGGKVTVPVDDAAVQKLEGRLAKATAALKRLQDQAAAGGGGSRELDAINEQLDALNSKRASLEAKAIRVRGDERELQKVRAVIDGISEEIDSLEKRQAEVAKVSVSTDEFKAQIAEAQDRVDRLTAALEKAKASGSVVDIKAKYDELTEAESTLGKLNRQLGKKVTAEFGVNVDIQTLDDVAKKAEAAGAVLGKLPRVMEELGRSDLTAATTKMRQMVSQSEELSKPIAAATQQFGTLTREVQAGFLPALSSVQSDLESLNSLIESGVAPTKAVEAAFNGVKESVDQTVASVARLAEASAKASRIKTGRELVFDQPGLSESLDRGASVGNKAAALPAAAIQANPRIVESLVDISRLSQQANAAYAKLQLKVAEGLPTGSAQRSLDLVVTKLNAAVDAADGFASAQEESQRRASAAGQMFLNVLQKESQALSGSGAADLAEYERNMQSLSDAKMRASAAGQMFLNVLQKESQALSGSGAADLAEYERQVRSVADARAMAASRERAAFVITGRPQNMDQADGRRGQLEGDISGLDRAQRQNYKPLLEDAAMARQLGDLDKYNDALDKIAFRLAQDKRFNVTTAQAKKDLDDLKATMDSLRDESNFVISAKVQNAGQAEAEIKRIVGGMEQLDAAQRQSLQPKVDAAISSLGTKDIAIISAAIKDLDDEFEKEREIKVKADEAKKSVDSLRESLGSIADRIGDPSEPIDRLRKAVDAANAAIAKMPAGAIKTKLEGDLNSEKVRIEAMARPGASPPTPPDIDAAAARANAIAAAAAAGTPAKATPNPLGADFGTAERRVASLQSTVMSLQSSLEKLPTPMQAQFIPAINKVRDAFQKLTPSSTAAEIDAVTKKAAGLERAFARAGQAAKFGGTLGEALNAAAITKTEKQLGFIRSKLLEVGATASGPVAAAFNTYSAAAADAAKAGISGTAATTRQLDGLIAKIGEALVAEGKLTAAQGKAFSKSVGDVGRAGADKFALALNQAAFAVDDFLSSTGGLEFKLRAISNNVTQLAFILGGTTGLFVGLGAVIAGQAAVGLIKWANNGRSAEDQTKALNEALARQKSLVEDLAQAFRSLGDAMSRGTFSAGGEQAAEFSRQMEDIRKKQKESREGRVADLDENVQTERAEQVKLRSDLEKSTDPSERVVIQRRINASIEKEKAAAESAASRVAGPDEARNRIRESLERVRLAELDPRGNDIRTFEAKAQEIREQAARDAEGVPVGNSADDIAAQRSALEKELERLSEKAKDAGRFFFPDDGANAARDAAIPLEKLLRSLDLPLLAAIDKAANEIAEASRGPAAQIRQAQEDVAEAIRRGVPNAAAFQRELDANAKKLKEAYVSLEEAQKERDPDKKRARVDEAKANIDQVEAEGADIRLRSREMRLGRTFGGERTTAALASIQGNERFGGDEYSIRTTAYIEAAIDREIEARGQLEVATAKGSDAEIKAAEAELEAAQRASEAAAAFGEAAVAVEAALSRIRKVGESALQRSEQGADAAQRAFEENPLRAGGGQSRDDAERRLIDDRARVAQAQVDLDIRRGVVQSDPRMQGINKELEAITQRRADLEAKARVGSLDPAERDELDSARKREVELMRQREHLARDLTEAERKQLDAINNGIAAREKELEKSRQRAAEDPTFKRRMDATNQLIADSERQANEAQERYINNPNAKTQKERDEAEENLRFDRQRAQELQDNLDNARKEMESDPRVAGNNKAISENDKRLAELAEKEARVGLTQDEKDERRNLQSGNRVMRRENQDIIAAGTETEQWAIDAERQGVIDRDRARRGRDLGMTDRERFRRDFEEGAGADINARADEMRRAGEDPTAFLRQALSNQMEQVAPMLRQFQDERQNALLQGPSRAALNVSDVSTSQGQSELNRLLRGDDPAKDVNLAELSKQTEKLQEIIDQLKANNPEVLL
jgi:chromosome segregation ATPase/uncharacterized protein YnzC (UPF0291/DUF896 family)